MTGDLYDWEHCDHAGIGQIGCPICDPDKGRVLIRLRRLDNIDLRKRVAALTSERDALRAALVAIASRVSPESRHQEWAAANGCDCVVCVAVAALRAVTL